MVYKKHKAQCEQQRNSNMCPLIIFYPYQWILFTAVVCMCKLNHQAYPGINPIFLEVPDEVCSQFSHWFWLFGIQHLVPRRQDRLWPGRDEIQLNISTVHGMGKITISSAECD